MIHNIQKGFFKSNLALRSKRPKEILKVFIRELHNYS